MKKAWVNFLKSLQPKYAVVVNMYHVIPGRPVKMHAHRHQFGNGEYDQAILFYNKVVKKHGQLNFPNTEIHLVKGKKKVVQKKNYGPVDLVKGLNVQSA